MISLTNIFRHTAPIVLTCVSLLSQDSKLRSAAQDLPYTDDQVLRYAISVDVAKLDSRLPSQPLQEWLLRGPARIDELNWWVNRDCDLKDLKPDVEGDLPLCVKFGFRRGTITGFGLLTVGTLKSGIKGKPALQYLDVLSPSSVGDYDNLSEFPHYLDGIAHTVAVAKTETPTASCRIVDAIATKTGDQYFVDGVRVPNDAYVIDYLRRAEVASQRSCLRLFVPTTVKIQDVEDMFVIATGKIQYQEFHAYLYDERRDSVNEISLWKTVDTATLRSSNGHFVPWPDLQPKRR